MIGLIKKDFLLIFKNINFVYLIPIVMVVITSLGNPTFLIQISSMMVSLIFAFQVSVTMTLDENAKWGKNISAMPISPVQEVGSKYILSLALALSSLIPSSIIGFSLNNFIKIGTNIVIYFLILAFCIVILYSAILIPATFKFGIAKSKMILFGFVFIPTIIPFIMKALKININLETIQLNNFFVGLIVFLIMIFFILVSFYLSVQIQKKKGGIKK